MNDKMLEECRAHWERTKPDAVFADYWLGWQAARESLVIELPPIWEESPNTALGQACAQIRTADIEAIKAVGLKVAQ